MDGEDAIVYGNAGADEIDGGDDDDQLFGDSGTDTLTGGLGSTASMAATMPTRSCGTHATKLGTSGGGEDQMLAFSLGQGDKLAFNFANFFVGVTLPGNFNDAGNVHEDYFTVVDVTGATPMSGRAAVHVRVRQHRSGANGTLWFDAEGDGDLTGADDVKIVTFDTASSVATITNDDLLLI